MAFVRRKRIKGRDYLYHVEGRWENGMSHQYVLSYIGPADDPTAQARAEALRRQQKQRRRR